MLVPSTPRWDIRLRAIRRIRRLVAEPSPPPAAGRALPGGDLAVEPGSDEGESLVVFIGFLRSLTSVKALDMGNSRRTDDHLQAHRDPPRRSTSERSFAIYDTGVRDDLYSGHQRYGVRGKDARN